MKNKIRLEIQKFINENAIFDKLDKDNKTQIENILTDTLADYNNNLAYWVFRNTERELHKEDVLGEIDNINEYDELEQEIKIDDKTLEAIVEDYEDFLGESGDWRYWAKEAIRRNMGDFE
jgi:hypothetical protein